MQTIAVEDDLTGVRDLLLENGFTVVGLSQVKKADAVVVTGLRNNILNRQEISTEAPVIDATGKTPQEILNSLRQYR